MKIKCLLVDDEPLAVKLLQKHIAQLHLFEVAGTSSNVMQALEILSRQQIDLLFLDIRMPKLSGIDLLKTMQRPPPTILTTAYREYAPESYDLDVVDYILKPVTFDRFFKAIEKYLRISNSTAPNILSSSEPQFIYLKSGHKYFIVDTRDILYAESVKDYVNVYTKEKTITSKYKISELKKELSGKDFLRIHRSFIINLKQVTALTGSDVEIGQIELPIGDAYKVFVQHLKIIFNLFGTVK